LTYGETRQRNDGEQAQPVDGHGTSPLDESIGFLMGVAYRKLVQLFAQRLKPYDITPEQWAVLVRIAEREGMIQKDIADRSGKDRPTVTRILDALESKSLIVRRICGSDRRSYRIFATEQGKALTAATIPIEREALTDAMEGFSDAEANELKSQLRRIAATIDRFIGKT
jgi:Transcriptional regulators